MTTYRHPRSWPIRFVVGGLAAVVALAALMAAAIGEGQTFVVLLLVGLATAVLVPEIWIVTHIAKELRLSDQVIQSTPLVGRTVSLRWGEIESAEQFSAFTMDFTRTDVIRLVAGDRRAVAFTSQIVGFEELMNAIRTRTSTLDGIVEPSWWRRLVFRGWP